MQEFPPVELRTDAYSCHIRIRFVVPYQRIAHSSLDRATID
jgi:hypothetical protein